MMSESAPVTSVAAGGAGAVGISTGLVGVGSGVVEIANGFPIGAAGVGGVGVVGKPATGAVEIG